MFLALNRIFILFLAVFLLTSCSLDELADGLSLKEANELIVYLNRSGIDAQRRDSGKRGRYSVVVSSSDSPIAYEVMHELGLPRTNRREEEIKKLFSSNRFGVLDKSLVDIKLDLISSIQAEKLLSAVEGVSDVSVVVKSKQIPDTDTQTSKVSLVAKVLPNYDTKEVEANIAKMIKNLIPNLSPSDLSVEVSQISISNRVELEKQNLILLEPFGFKVLKAEKINALKNLVYFFVVTLFAGIILGSILARAFLYKLMVNKKIEQSSEFLINNDKE